MNRRQWLALATAAGTSSGSSVPAVRLSIGTYGLQNLPVEESLRKIREIGYDGAELCLMPGWPSEPAKLDAAARKRIRDFGFPIPSLIENLNLLVSEEIHRRSLERIQAAAELAHSIAPDDPPLLQTVLGGKPGEWEAVKEKMADRLDDWARIARQSRLRLAIKSHIGSASDTPEKLIWLLDRVKSPAVTGIYDYSHFQLMGLDLEKSLELLLPRSSFITVKDAAKEGGPSRFLLPGEGTIDYVRYTRKLKSMQWSGWMLVEVSRQLQTLPGYDGVEAARKSYRNLAPILRAEGLRG